MATLATLVVKLRAEIGDFVKGLDDAERQTMKFARQAQRSGMEMTQGLTVPIVGLGALLFKAAEDVAITERRFGLAFGNMAGPARAFSEQLARDLGLSADKIREAMVVPEQGFRAMGLSAQTAVQMSEGVVKLAQDLSVTSGAGKSVDEIIRQLTKGLEGSTRGMKDLGIVIDPNVVKAYGLAHGLVGLHETMSTGTKAVITYRMMLEQTANVQGSFARSTNDPLVMLRQMKEGAIEAAEKLGTSLMPAFVTIIKWAKDLAGGIRSVTDWLAALPRGLKDFIVYAGLAVAAIGPLVFVVGKIISGVGGLINILGLLKNGLLLLISPAGLAVAAFVAVGVAVYELATHWTEFKEQVVLAWTATVDFVLRGVSNLLLGFALLAGAAGLTRLSDGFYRASDHVKAANEAMLASTNNTLVRMDRLITQHANRGLAPGVVTTSVAGPAAAMVPDLVGTPGVSNLPTQAERIADALRKMDEQLSASRMEAQLLGLSFNEPAARAQELQRAFKEIAEAGATADQRLDAHGRTLRSLGRDYQVAIDGAKRFADMTQSLGSAVASGIGTMAAAFGKAIATGGNLFKALGQALLQGLGNVAASIGQRLIEMGVLLKLAFTLSPMAMIAAGIGLVALGAMLGAASSGLQSGGASGAGSSYASSAGVSSSAGGSEGSPTQGTVTIVLSSDGYHLDPRNPRAVDEFAHMLSTVSGRNVIVRNG